MLKFIDNRKSAIISGDPSIDSGFDEYDVINKEFRGGKINMNSLEVKVDGGYLHATISGDVNYPGIWVEFVADDDKGESVSRPTVLVEKPVDDELRVLVWSDEDDEDYTTEIKFN